MVSHERNVNATLDMKNQPPSANASSSPGRIYSLIVIGFAVFVACLTIDALRAPLGNSRDLKEPAASAPKSIEEANATTPANPAAEKVDAAATLAVATTSASDGGRVDRQRFSQLLVIAGLSALAAFFLPANRVATSSSGHPTNLDADRIAEATGLRVLGEIFPNRSKPAASIVVAPKPRFHLRRAVVLLGELTLCLGFAVAIAGSTSQSKIAKQFPTDPLNAYTASVRVVAGHVNSLLGSR